MIRNCQVCRCVARLHSIQYYCDDPGIGGSYISHKVICDGEAEHQLVSGSSTPEHAILEWNKAKVEALTGCGCKKKRVDIHERKNKES